jgi:hypothetical protein
MFKRNGVQEAWLMHLPRKRETLSSNPSTAKKKKQREKEKQGYHTIPLNLL